jgi:hypothetical protein
MAARAVQALVGTEDGKIFLAYLAAKYGFSRRSTVVPDSTSMTYANEGQRTVLIDIGFLMDADILKLAELEQAEHGDSNYE